MNSQAFQDEPLPPLPELPGLENNSSLMNAQVFAGNAENEPLPPLPESCAEIKVEEPQPKKRKYRKLEKIDLSDVPPQPLILKNRLPKEYTDNSRRRPTSAKSSKYLGVYFDAKQKKWKAQMMIDGNVRSLGYHPSEEAAAAVYAKAAFKFKAKKPNPHVYGDMDLSNVPPQELIRRVNIASQFKGVHKNGDRWEARIEGKVLGTFDTPEEAAGIYARAAYFLNSQRQTETDSPAEEVQAPSPAYATRQRQPRLEMEAAQAPAYATRQRETEAAAHAAFHQNQPMFQMPVAAPDIHAYAPRLDLPVEAPLASNQAMPEQQRTASTSLEMHFEEARDGLELPMNSAEMWGPIYEI